MWRAAPADVPTAHDEQTVPNSIKQHHDSAKERPFDRYDADDQKECGACCRAAIPTQNMNPNNAAPKYPVCLGSFVLGYGKGDMEKVHEMEAQQNADPGHHINHVLGLEKRRGRQADREENCQLNAENQVRKRTVKRKDFLVVISSPNTADEPYQQRKPLRERRG